VRAETLLAEMDRAGVRGALIVPPSFEGDRNDLGLSAVATYPDRFRVLGRFRLVDEGSLPALEASLRDPGFVGVRLTFNAQAASWLRDDTIEWFWEYAETRSVAVSLFPHPPQFDDVVRLARRHSSLKLSLDHLACSEDPSTFDSMEQIERIARFSELQNVAVKASALPVSFPTTYSPETVSQIMTKLVAWYGSERIFWGSDLTRAPDVDYADALAVFLAGLDQVSGANAELVMGAGLRTWFGWPADGLRAPRRA
jgi:predicted TIM-barrel fold metal-dependent hydrolase